MACGKRAPGLPTKHASLKHLSLPKTTSEGREKLHPATPHLHAGGRLEERREDERRGEEDEGAGLSREVRSFIYGAVGMIPGGST